MDKSYTLKRLSEMRDEHMIIRDVKSRGLTSNSSRIRKGAIPRSCRHTGRDSQEELDSAAMRSQLHKRSIPLIITPEQMEKGLDVVGRSISEVEKQLSKGGGFGRTSWSRRRKT